MDLMFNVSEPGGSLTFLREHVTSRHDCEHVSALIYLLTSQPFKFPLYVYLLTRFDVCF